MTYIHFNLVYFIWLILLINIKVSNQIQVGEIVITDISELKNGEGGKKFIYKPTSEYFQLCVFGDQKLSDLSFYTPQVNISKGCYNKLLSKNPGATDILIYKFFRIRNSTELEPGNIKAGITNIFEVYYQFIYYKDNNIDESMQIDIESTCNENILLYYMPSIPSTLQARYLNVYKQNPISDPDIEDLQGYDILNPNSDFYNTVCAIYTYNTYLENFIIKETRLNYYDLSLEMRKKYYFPASVEICPVTCDYIVTLNKEEGLIALCKCEDQHFNLLEGEVPQYQTFSSVYYDEDKFINSDKDNYFSIEVFKCFKITMMFGFLDNYGSYMVLGIGVIISFAFGAIFLWGKGRIMTIFELLFNNNINNLNYLKNLDESNYSKTFENSISNDKNNNLNSKNLEQSKENKTNFREDKNEEEKNKDGNEENEEINEEEEEEDIELAHPPKKIIKKKKIKVKKKKVLQDNIQNIPIEEPSNNKMNSNFPNQEPSDEKYKKIESNIENKYPFTQESRKNIAKNKINYDKNQTEQIKKNKILINEQNKEIPKNAQRLKKRKGSRVYESEETNDEENYMPDIGSSLIVIPIDNIFSDQELNFMDLDEIYHYDQRSYFDVYFSILNAKCPIFFIFSYYNSNKGISLTLQIKYPAIKLIFFSLTIYICFFFNATVFGSKSITYRITNQYDFGKKVTFASILAPFCLMVQNSIYFGIFYEITRKITKIKVKLFTSLFINNGEDAKNVKLKTILEEQEDGGFNKNYKENSSQFNNEELTKKDIKEERVKLKNEILDIFDFLKKRLLISIGCFVFVILFMWYYIAAFGSCYRNTQVAFLLNILITFVFCNIIPCFYCFIPALFRKLAVDRQDTRFFTCYRIFNII